MVKFRTANGFGHQLNYTIDFIACQEKNKKKFLGKKQQKNKPL